MQTQSRILLSAAYAILGLAIAHPCYASSIAFDSAAGAAYDDGWQAGDNGGSGLGAWVFNNNAGSGSAGQFVFSSVDNGNSADDGVINGVANDGDIDTADRAWGMYANGDSAATAIADRPLIGELSVGQTVSVDMDNGYIDGGGRVGVFFGNGSGVGIGVYFEGGQGNYTAVVGQSGSYTNVTTTLGFADEGLSVKLSRTATNVGALTITLPNGDSQTLATDFINLNPVNTVSLLNQNAGSGGSNNAYFNSIQVIPEPATLALVGLCGLGLLWRRPAAPSSNN